ncbi:MAG: fibronectin type III domain-containing protein, partial [Saprospiraceae bacterium]|nr:fibronectin type III domain-containing protein [Saprospiraceae bacterium]
MRTFITLQSVCLLSVLFICTQDLSAHAPHAAFYGGDSTCMDTFFLKYKGANSFDFKVYPACDTIQWRYAQVDAGVTADAVADSLWTEGSATDTCCFTIDGLDPSTTYLVQLRGWCPESGMYSDWSEAILDSTRCVGPDDETLSHSNLTSSSVTLNTTAASDNYEWSLRRTSSWSIRHIETTEGHINWIHLPANMEYEWKVRVKCSDGTWSDYSNPRLFSTGEHAVNDCDTLKDSHVSYNNVTSSSANLHCHMHGNKYSWGMRKYGTSNWQTHSTSSGFYQWKNLDPGSKYEYKVKVECEDGYWTDWSTVKYFTTKDDNSCHTPSSHHLSVTEITYNSAYLHCSLDGYEYHWVVRKKGSYSWKDLNTTKASYHW